MLAARSLRTSRTQDALGCTSICDPSLLRFATRHSGMLTTWSSVIMRHIVFSRIRVYEGDRSGPSLITLDLSPGNTPNLD